MAPGLTDTLIGKIQSKNRLQRAFLVFARKNLKVAEVKELDLYIEHCLRQGHDLNFLTECYRVIVQDTVKEQLYFRRNGRYRHSSYDDVDQLTYQNPAYMQAYMHGLALTSWLWPNHVAIYRWFVEKLPKSQSGSYLEIGPGPGHFMRAAIRHSSYENYLGVDISPTSAALTKAMLSGEKMKSGRQWSIEIQDFLKFGQDRMFDAIVMGEVLEHVNEPQAFLKKLRLLSHPKSFIFVTTAINAPAIDHIFLFPDAASVEALAQSCGLRVRDRLVLPYHGVPMKETIRQKLPINIALVLSHAGNRERS